MEPQRVKGLTRSAFAHAKKALIRSLYHFQLGSPKDPAGMIYTLLKVKVLPAGKNTYLVYNYRIKLSKVASWQVLNEYVSNTNAFQFRPIFHPHTITQLSTLLI